MNRKQIVARNKRVLSNRADGNGNLELVTINGIEYLAAPANAKQIAHLSAMPIKNTNNGSNVILGNAPGERLDAAFEDGTGDFFEFSIDNTAGAAAKKIAILPGHMSTMGMGTTEAGTSVLHYHNTKELENYGIKVDAIIDDASIDSGGKPIVISAVDPSYTIRNFLDYLSMRSFSLQSIEITGQGLDSYKGNMEIYYTNPCNRGETRRINVKKFFDKFQYQDGRMTARVKTKFILTKDMVWTIIVPAGQNIDVTLNF